MKINQSFFIYIVGFVVFLACKNAKEQPIEASRGSKSEPYRLTRHILPSEIIEGYVEFIPESFYAHDKVNFVYELHLINNNRQAFLLDNIEVFDTENDSVPIAKFDKDYLAAEFERRGIQRGDSVRMLGGNQFGVVHLWLKMDRTKPLPKQIFHKLNFRVERADGSGRNFPIEVALIDFPKPTTLTIPLPFKKGIWFYGATSHKKSRIITEGKATYAQRFALDWVYLEDNGTLRKGDLEKNESYLTYGIEVLAVADGIVIDVNDGVPENMPNSDKMPIKLTRETGSGNSVTIDIGNGIHAHYAHFIPDSPKVKEGEKVKKGQVIGHLGNSGNSTGPHLHFHLETASKYPVGGEGIPYHIENFDQYINFEDEEWPKWDSLFLKEKIPLPQTPIATRVNELPIANGFVKFE